MTPADIKVKYRSADFVANDRVIFNIGGNKYRLVVAAEYARKERQRISPGIVFIKFVGTHAEYDTIDPKTV
jgi:mRNA interferase HigB